MIISGANPRTLDSYADTHRVNRVPYPSRDGCYRLNADSSLFRLGRRGRGVAEATHDEF